MNDHFVYRYTCPIRNEPIYIGLGTKKRHLHHLKRKDVHPLTSRISWIRKQGQEPVIDIIVSGIDLEFANLVEMEAIAKYGRKDLGKGPLLNLTDGGDGVKNTNPESRKRQGFRKKHTEKTCLVISQKAKAQFATEESRQEMSLLVKERMSSTEIRTKISEGVKRVAATPEHFEKQSSAQQKAWADPEVRARQLAARQTPEFKAKWAATTARKRLERERKQQ